MEKEHGNYRDSRGYMTLSTSYPGHCEVASVAIADAGEKAAKTGLGPSGGLGFMQALLCSSLFPQSPVCKSHVLPPAYLPTPKPGLFSGRLLFSSHHIQI